MRQVDTIRAVWNDHEHNLCKFRVYSRKGDSGDAVTAKLVSITPELNDRLRKQRLSTEQNFGEVKGTDPIFVFGCTSKSQYHLKVNVFHDISGMVTTPTKRSRKANGQFRALDEEDYLGEAEGQSLGPMQKYFRK